MKSRINPNSVPQNGPAIREIREREGLTVSELARAVDISDSHLRNIENENRAARPEHLARIAKKLRCRGVSPIVRTDDEQVPA